jgi:hypothetical protein
LKKNGQDKNLRELTIDTSAFETCFSEDWLKLITPSILQKTGFKKIDNETYNKSFSHVLELKINIINDNFKTYIWTMNEKPFEKMCDKLESIKTYVDKKAEELYLVTVLARKRKNPLNPPDILAGFSKKKQNFYNKYHKFVDINNPDEISPPFPRTQYFFFDACKTEQQFKLYIHFIKLSMDIFYPLKKSRRGRPKKIPPDKIRQGISTYYAYSFTFKKIRNLCNRNWPFDRLENKFPMIPKKLIEDITLDCFGEKKGWQYKASNIAYEFGSEIANTSVGNFKQILKAEKEFTRETKTMISQVKDIEKTLSGEIPLPINDRKLKREYFSKKEFINYWTWWIVEHAPLLRPL